MRTLYLSLVFIILSTLSYGQERFFYTGKEYGSQALYNPLYLILNGSYDIIQLDGNSREIFRFPYTKASQNVFRNLASPFGAVKRFGIGKFISNELIPLNLGKAGAQWWPNYQLHLIGGGMTFRAVKEWYSYHKYPYPGLFSVATVSAYHLLNEFVENGDYRGDNVDPIADIYFFDIGGILLFSSDEVCRFFSNTLNLADWSLQPSFNLNNISLQNNGQYFSIKWKIPYQERFHLFYYFGMNGLTGLSYKFADGSAISAAAGLRAKKRLLLNETTNLMTIDMVWNAGLFYDRNNSLLASLHVSGLTDYMVDLNIYPGIVYLGKFSPGLWMVMKKNGNLMLGITTTYAPGLSGF